jgi:bifunctional UDP-N-acetylglucosamine pyrophosphorylase / glucosamine-1-phosphate N-acetyltransferase
MYRGLGELRRACRRNRPNPPPGRAASDYDSGVSGAPTVLVMAAGEGTRMRSSVPKVLHRVCGRPMIAWPVFAALEAGADKITVIVSPDHDLSPALPNGVETVVQPEADGTGGAVRAARELLGDGDTVLVLSGDHPLISAELITNLLDAHRSSGAAATVMTIELDEPGSYGRIVRDAGGDLERIAETKNPGDATPEELAIRETNTGTYVFAAEPLTEMLGRITNDNAQGEYYLGDVLPLMRGAGLEVATYRTEDQAVNLGVNTRVELADVNREARRRILDALMLAGVTVVDPDATWIDADVEIERDATIEPGCFLRGATRVGRGAVVGPFTTLVDTVLGSGATALYSHLVACEVLDRCSVGPFTYIRPHTTLREGAKAGAFVEIKASDVGPGSKVPHLSYVGDAEIGEDANVGAGAITANWDGFRKHRTVIGDHVRIGVDTALVPPVHVGDAAYTGAGSVITEDVPPGALGISRPEQRNVEGYAEKVAREATTDQEEEAKRGKAST